MVGSGGNLTGRDADAWRSDGLALEAEQAVGRYGPIAGGGTTVVHEPVELRVTRRAAAKAQASGTGPSAPLRIDFPLLAPSLVAYRGPPSPASGSTIHPSRSWMVRCPYAAFRSECVTCTIVVPCAVEPA